MPNILNSDDFGLKLYNRFPPKYRDDDVGQNYALKRYLQALSDGGFKYSIDEINGITALIDPDRVDAKVLPILFKQYGLDIFNGIPEEYLRYLLPKLGEAWSKKGSLSVIEFITSSISGIKASTEVEYDLYDNPLVNIILEMDFNIGDYYPDIEQFKRLIQNFIPFYCDLYMFYSYLFYESQVLVAKEYVDTLKISNNIEETVSIIHGKSNIYYSQLNNELRLLNSTLILNESYLSDSPDYHEDKIILAPIFELADITREHSTDFNEDSILLLVKENPKTKVIENVSSVLNIPSEESFNISCIDDIVFGDIIVNTVEESIGIKELTSTTSYLNSTSHTLNNTFYISGDIRYSCYDIIRKNGTETYIYH